MRTSVLIASILAVVVTAAPAAAPPAAAPAPGSCTAYCCPSLQPADSPTIIKILASYGITRNDDPGMVGIGCIVGHCPTRIVGHPACCSGKTVDRSVTTGCVDSAF